MSVTNPYRAKRDAFREITDFIEGGECLFGKVLVLSGLRRTGKTTLIEQYVAESPYRDKCAFYTVENGDTIKDIKAAIRKDSEEDDVTVFFFDEITKAKDFVTNSAALADIYAKEGLRIVLSGTDTLGFYFAELGELAFRVEKVHTTHIPFAEHCRIFGERDIDDYIRFGGLMKEGANKSYVKNYEEALRYLDESVADNIANSLDKAPNESNLDKLTKNEMRSVVEKLVELYNGQFDKKVVREELTKASVTYPISKLDGLVDKALIRRMDSQRDELVREFLSEIHADETVKTEVSEAMVIWLGQYLREIGVLSTIEKRRYVKNEDSSWASMPKEHEYYIAQPAIRYYHIKEAQKMIETSDFYSMLPNDAKEFVAATLEEQILGLMTEQIVLFDTKKYLPHVNYEVCKPSFEINRHGQAKPKTYEYDMLVYNRQVKEYYAFEIKHSREAIPEQCESLAHPELREIMDKNFHKRACACVLYLGNSFVTTDGVAYLNIADFLAALDLCKNLESAVELLTRNLEVKDLAAEETHEKNITKKY